jgi:hypothetical protein
MSAALTRDSHESPEINPCNYRQKVLTMPQRLSEAKTFWKHWEDGQIEGDFGSIYGIWHRILSRNQRALGGNPDAELLAYKLLPSPKPSLRRLIYVSFFPHARTPFL